ncbi:MAG TPA: acyltransferase, partial [Flavobacterium sp.]|nr:acyltransferase [Flavobacterium sp.]
KDHVPALDGLRGIAVLLVLLSHTSNNNFYFHEALAFNGIGKGGVYLFYVLSAFLLDRQIAAAMLKQSADTFFWKRYFIRRFLRIYPLFIFSLVLFWALAQFGIPTTIMRSEDILWHALLLKGMGVFWSIPVEFKYYLISPLIMIACQRFFRWDVKKIMIFFLILSVCSFISDLLFDFHKISTLKYLTIFLTGTFISVWLLLKDPLPRLPGWAMTISLAGFLALIMCLVMNPNYMGDWFGISNSNNGRKVMLIYALCCGVMLFAAVQPKGWFSQLMRLKLLRLIGVISFSVYLMHMPVIFLMKSNVINIPAKTGIYFFFIATFTLSLVTFFLIERPLSRIRIAKRTYPAPDPL